MPVYTQRPTTSQEIFNLVSTVLQDRLGVEEEEVRMDARIMGDLGAESIDVIGILHELERSGITIERNTLMLGGTTDNGAADELTAEALRGIQESMPFASFENVKPGGDMTVGDLFTVRLLCQAAANVLGIEWQKPATVS